jgi:hypothetical protein
MRRVVLALEVDHRLVKVEERRFHPLFVTRHSLLEIRGWLRPQWSAGDSPARNNRFCVAPAILPARSGETAALPRGIAGEPAGAPRTE